MPIDEFYARVIEHAVAYFGSRVLYPSRPAPSVDDRTCCRARPAKKLRRRPFAATRSKFEATAQEWGYRIGSQIYDAYLAGKVAPSGLRRLFLAHLDEPGLARKVCAAVICETPLDLAAPLARVGSRLSSPFRKMLI